VNKYNLVIIRHGQSQWNHQGRFTGWVDVDLSEKGCQEAKKAAELLVKVGVQYNVAFTSVLTRAMRTLWIISDEMNLMWTPVSKSWILHERHYGELTGAYKKDIIEKYGAEQVQLWRRSYRIVPPPLSKEKEQEIKKWSVMAPDSVHSQKGESLQQTKSRILPLWEHTMVPVLKEGAQLLVVAHGNSLRALMKHIECLGDQEVVDVEIPTGVPIAYQLSVSDLSVQEGRTVIE